MSLGKKLFIGGDTDCTADTTDVFGDSSGIALYTLDYDASDESGNYDGTPSNVTFGVDGQINYGASFNGSSSIIKDVLGSGFTYASKTMTFSAWIFVEDASNDNVIIGDGFATATGGWAIATGYGSAPDRRLSFNVASSAMGGVQQNYSSVSVPDNTWTHIAVSVDFSDIANTVKMYINGTEDTSITEGITGAFVDNTTYNTAIGGTWTGSAGRLFEGKIDQVRVFNKALSSSEVSTLYGETACVYTSTTDQVNYQGTNLAYYKFDNSAEDETGNHDGTEYNVNYRFGRYGQGVNLTGSSSYISVPHNSSFNWTNNKTVSFWVKFDNLGTGSIGLVAKGRGGSGPYGWYIYKSGSTSKILFANYDSSNNDSTVYSDNAVVAGRWYHVCVTGDGTTNKLYIDGVLNDSANAITAQNLNDILVIGRIYSDYDSYYLDGTIDQLRFYESTLDATAVENLYNEKQEAELNFNTVLYDGNGGTQYVSNVGFQPDLVWIKNRDASYSNMLYDSIRGAGQDLSSDTSGTEGTVTGLMSSFNANGFTVVASGSNRTNFSGQDYVAWCWKGGGTAVSNTNGDITSQVSANQDAGFSIVKYTATGTTATVGHGLSSKPQLIIAKTTNQAYNWLVYAEPITAEKYLILNLTNAEADNTAFMNDTEPTSSVFTAGAGNNLNYANNDIIVAYCFHSVAGYQKVGSYTGSTGLVTENVGFEPRFLMIKNASSSYDWIILDNLRPSGSGFRSYLYPSDTYIETTYSSSLSGISFTSTGFTIDNDNSGVANENGSTFIYLAIA